MRLSKQKKAEYLRIGPMTWMKAWALWTTRRGDFKPCFNGRLALVLVNKDGGKPAKPYTYSEDDYFEVWVRSSRGVKLDRIATVHQNDRIVLNLGKWANEIFGRNIIMYLTRLPAFSQKKENREVNVRIRDLYIDNTYIGGPHGMSGSVWSQMSRNNHPYHDGIEVAVFPQQLNTPWYDIKSAIQNKHTLVDKFAVYDKEKRKVVRAKLSGWAKLLKVIARLDTIQEISKDVFQGKVAIPDEPTVEDAEVVMIRVGGFSPSNYQYRWYKSEEDRCKYRMSKANTALRHLRKRFYAEHGVVSFVPKEVDDAKV